MPKECRSMVLIKAIDEHPTADAFNTHDLVIFELNNCIVHYSTKL